ncbi:hypothetical protein Pmani_025333 [Petrolisthes manimaculis]|uniref:Uncharacterized protein n=1 Tax=Petrolisthes manimaculis TaxID=1843537 RepID=A0AAE1P8B2_9EUCA|nr:hypothetical protein Pmani_025333 [Petrolisthes manimaculis]
MPQAKRTIESSASHVPTRLSGYLLDRYQSSLIWLHLTLWSSTSKEPKITTQTPKALLVGSSSNLAE